MIEMEINDSRSQLAAQSMGDVRDAIQRSLPEGHLVSALAVNGEPTDPEELERFDLRQLRSVSVHSATPQQIARASLPETTEWIGRICGVLDGIGGEYRVGRATDATGRLVDVVDALQVLAALLASIRDHIDIPTDARAEFEASWSESGEQLRDCVESLCAALAQNDPVELADLTGGALPQVLGRFTSLLEGLK